MSGRPLSREDSEHRRFMGAIYSHRYYRKNREQRNTQTRERMARLRRQDSTVPPDVLEARLAARREAARKYREKNKRTLKLKAREQRAAARGLKEQQRLHLVTYRYNRAEMRRAAEEKD
ncbi:hypothetical protein DFH06DRAFT_1136232 [Mycena polygramma]|nr:hypothetical protein DFH06DRAFT_1136232 [Mycena polygramma]